MAIWLVVLFAVGACQDYKERGLTETPELVPRDMLPNVAVFGDAEHRGPKWYSYSSSRESGDGTDLKSEEESYSSSISTSSISSSSSSEASSVETKERRRATQTHRTCTPCPEDMLKKHINRGIKWICASYQRARRTFKSICMMRYRNCQDGTMFVKIHDQQCKNDSYHGKHWFYIYRV